MRAHARLLGATALLLGAGLLAAVGPTRASDKEALRAKLDKMAAVAAADPKAAATEAQAFAKGLDEEGFTEVMDLFRKRTKEGKGGWGVGAKPTGMPDDGMEARIQNLSRKPLGKADLDKLQADLAQMAYRTAVIGEITIAKTPAKKVGEKDPKDWKEYSQEMVSSAYNLAKALKAGEPKMIREASGKLNSSCSNCHGKFRD